MMTSHCRPLRIALFGLPGAGKSTSAALLRERLEQRGARPAVVRIAAPLYDVQDAFYGRTGTPLASGQQDGVLLNFLGTHFRTTAPGFLLEDFRRRCDEALLAEADVLICDDARPVDLEEVAKQGFTLVRISAPDDLRRARKSGRGDRTRGNDADPDHEIDNAGDLDRLAGQVDSLVDALLMGAPSAVTPTDPQDLLQALVRRAAEIITPRYAENRHQIGAVILDGGGRVFTGIHVEAMVGRASVCAEAVALGKAREAGATDLRLVLAVRHPKPGEADRRIRTVPPCGLCRELLLDYGPAVRAVVATPEGLVTVPLAELLPYKYVGTKWNTSRTAQAASEQA
jgi:cytidine deaminase